MIRRADSIAQQHFFRPRPLPARAGRTHHYKAVGGLLLGPASPPTTLGPPAGWLILSPKSPLLKPELKLIDLLTEGAPDHLFALFRSHLLLGRRSINCNVCASHLKACSPIQSTNSWLRKRPRWPATCCCGRPEAN